MQSKINCVYMYMYMYQNFDYCLFWFLSNMQITMVADKQGKPRGYAFIEYERERDMNCK